MECRKDELCDISYFHRKHGVRELITKLDMQDSEVPEYFVKPMIKPEAEVVVCNMEEIPCIDLHALQSGGILATIKDACKTWGLFYLVNHGVPTSLQKDIQECTREFFALPHEEKLQVTTEVGFIGPVHFGGGGNRDWREVLRIHLAPPSEVAKESWPSKPLGFRTLLEEYNDHLQTLSKDLLKFISLSLGLNESFLLEACGEAKMSITINHAPPSLNPSLTTAHQAHSDPNMLTLILQDDVGGLQVYKDGFWIDVKPLKNSFVVNLGDQVQIITNAKYKSCLHRVMSNNHSARTSTAYFTSPSRNSIIGPTLAFIDENNSPLYTQQKYGEYVDNFYKKAERSGLTKEPNSSIFESELKSILLGVETSNSK